MKATDKQIAFLAKKGIDATQLDSKQASDEIKAVINKEDSNKVDNDVIHKTTDTITNDFVKAKKASTSSSFYISYAKDIYIALAQLGRLDSNLMEESIRVVKQARDAFE